MAILCREIVTSFVVDFRAFLKMLVGKIWRKEEKSILRWSRCVSDAMVLFSWKHQSLAMLLYPCQYIDKPGERCSPESKPTPKLASKTKLSCLILEQCHIGALRLAGAPQLCSLDIASCSWTEQSSIAIAEMPALRTLRYSGAMANRHMINGADSLDEAVLAIEKPQALLEPNLRELLALVGNVRSLVLSPWCIEKSNHLDVNNLKQFAHPEEWSKVRLDKVRRLACIIERREEGALSIAPLLTSCPNVQELSVSVLPSQSKRRRCSDSEVQYRVIGGRGMIVRNLREIRMEYIDESKSGLDLVKLLLKKAQMLEMMTIVPSMDGLEQAKFRRRVLKFRKASRNVNIQFCATA
ncbi:unnamed protein product [Triticum turgidum subsp. durum]|uniref:FBD domain-containing protein n=1 Tax=Triticum turgidum subsp. durum TaxID=4567 RepID=A0A9R1B1P6_TRITD|nr:unnamed protein product [Triticum turgidum subsp. durum]